MSISYALQHRRAFEEGSFGDDPALAGHAAAKRLAGAGSLSPGKLIERLSHPDVLSCEMPVAVPIWVRCQPHHNSKLPSSAEKRRASGARRFRFLEPSTS